MFFCNRRGVALPFVSLNPISKKRKLKASSTLFKSIRILKEIARFNEEEIWRTKEKVYEAALINLLCNEPHILLLRVVMEAISMRIWPIQ